MEEVLGIIKEEFRIAMALSGEYLYFNLNGTSVYIVTSSLRVTIKITIFYGKMIFFNSGIALNTLTK